VRALVLVNTGGFVPNTLFTDLFCRLMGMPTLTRAIMPWFVRAYMRARTAADEQIVAQVIGRARSDTGAAMAASLWRSFATPEYDLRGQANRIVAPTLIVWGDRDPSLSLRVGRATNRVIPDSTLAVLHTGHVVFSSDPEGFLALVEPFLQRVHAASAKHR
jgi:pimeloyl-ACP methyl ester carboxylesterase